MTPDAIRAARKALGLTQAQMAAMAGVSVPYWGALETNAAKAAALGPTLRRLVHAYLSGYRPPDWPA
jgi:transcriptional regulator with XRE-family HTH domain